METPKEKRYLRIHDGHCTFLVPEEHCLVTPKAIQGTCLVGDPQEIIDQLRRAESAGLKEASLLPPMAYSRRVLKDFAEQVIKRY